MLFIILLSLKARNVIIKPKNLNLPFVILAAILNNDNQIRELETTVKLYKIKREFSVAIKFKMRSASP